MRQLGRPDIHGIRNLAMKTNKTEPVITMAVPINKLEARCEPAVRGGAHTGFPET